MHIRTLFWGFVFLLAFSFSVKAQAKRKSVTPGQRAVVVDERLSALRTQPDVKAPLDQRLRRGRVIGILGAKKSKGGEHFFRISVSRNTRGWVLAEAVAQSGNSTDAARLLKLVEETDDDFIKVRLAKVCSEEFRSTELAPRCLIKLGEAAERAAERLTRDAKRRAGNEESGSGLSKQSYFLNFNGLDRYNRIGVLFDYDEKAERFVYDGNAYRELLKKYATSSESQKAREQLEKSATR